MGEHRLDHLDHLNTFLDSARDRHWVARTIAFVTTLFLAGSMTGCTGQTATTSDWDPSSASSALAHAQKMGYKQAADVLADGKVTEEEWKTLHLGWVACMTMLGYDFDPPLLDPINGREYIENRTYKGQSSGPSNADQDKCDAQFDFSVGQMYYNDTPASMDPTLLAATHTCLEAKGVNYAGNETKYQDFFAAKDQNLGGATSGPVADCVSESMKKLYPTLVSWGLGF